MSETLTLPDQTALVWQEHDARSDDFDEADLSFALERSLKELGDLSDQQRRAGFAEIAALQFSLKRDGQKCRWGTRFGPVIEMTAEDGAARFFPDIAHVDEPVIRCWQHRAAVAVHPVLRARYADVLWDLTKAAISTKPSIEMARQAMDAYIECGRRFPNTGKAEERFERALELALSVGDKTRVGQAVDGMFLFVDGMRYPAARAVWLFDSLYDHRGIELTPDQQQKIIDLLESELRETCEGDNPVGIVAKTPALRLARHYERIGKPEEIKRVIQTYGDAVAKFAGKTEGFVAMHWFQEVYATYLQFGLKADAEQFQIAGKQKGEDAKGQMRELRVAVEVPKEQMEKYLDAITDGDLELTLNRIAFAFCPSVDELRQELDRERGSLFSMIPVANIGQNHVTARAGPLESDPEGRLMWKIADDLKGRASLLGIVMDRIRAKFDFTADTLIAFLFKSPAFAAERRPLFEHAINAYLRGDHITAIHVLVPQVEYALRRLLGILGKPTDKHRRSDLTVMVEKSLNDVLEGEPAMQACLSDDVVMYFRVFLCDARGVNVRNDLAHGLLQPQQLSRCISDRLLHILFVLGLVRPATVPSHEGEDRPQT